ncbi:MAG TPA: adenylate/guanylate cyclase domain-containing protein [Anaerolineae bacterium]|nr:adenylate/guanylate cyclase domain-containing protein [Anaerolineae bacterium]
MYTRELQSVLNSNQSILRDVARQVAAYIPQSLVEEILTEGLPELGEGHYFVAATLMADISGFVRMAEGLTRQGARGTEELNRILLQTFTPLVNAIHDTGGYVSHFYGDAMAVYFPDDDGQAAMRALACARLMQSLMQSSFQKVVTYQPGEEPLVFELSLKVGVGYGPCVGMVVGDLESECEYVVAGEAVTEAFEAQSRAASGEIVASRLVLGRAGLVAGEAFRVVTEWLPVPAMRAPLYWESFSRESLQRLVEVVKLFIPESIYMRLVVPETTFLAEHRPATSMFVRFTGIDFGQENGAALLQWYYEHVRGIVARYGGDNSRLNRVIIGDKGNHLHIIFGAPVAPDAPDQALRCALALQREKPAFIEEQAIGVATGLVFAGPVGSQKRREYTIVGDVVNLSSRVSQLEEALGGVMTVASVAKRVGTMMDLVPLPPVEIKGKREAMTVYEVRGEQGDLQRWQQRFGVKPTPVIGRQKERDLLFGGLDAALRGVGGLAVVTSGVGVSSARLAGVGAHYWLEQGGQLLYGSGQSHLRDVPYSLWQTVWHDLLRLSPDMSMAQKAVWIWEWVEHYCPEMLEQGALLGGMLGVPMQRTTRLEEMTAEGRQASLFPLLRACLAAVTGRQAYLIVLEDLQWADQLSLDLLNDLAQYVVDMSLFIVVTYRTDTGFRWRLPSQYCVPITLGALPAAEGRKIVAAVLGVSQLPLMVEQSLGLRDGEGRHQAVDPLFLEESLQMMLERGVLEEENGRWRVNEERLANLPVSDTLNTLLLARLDSLSMRARTMLQIASVIGREFGQEILEQVGEDIDEDVLDRLLTELVAAGMIQQVGLHPPTYRFQHTVIHEVVYNSLSYARRHVVHQRVAEYLYEKHQPHVEPILGMLAYHYGRSDQHAQALEYGIAAADEANKILAHQEAVDLYTLAETHLKQMPLDMHWGVALHIYQTRAGALRLLGDLGNALRDARRAQELAEQYNDFLLVFQARILVANICYQLGEYEEVKREAGLVINHRFGQVPPALMAEVQMWAGMAAVELDERRVALEHLREAERLYGRMKNHQGLSRTLSAMALLQYSEQEPQLALAIMQRAVDLAREFGSPAQIGGALYQVGEVQMRLGQMEAALSTFLEVVRLARGSSRHLLGQALIKWGYILGYLGRYDEAKVVFEEATDLYAMMDDQQGLIDGYLLWAEAVYLPLEAWDEGERCLAQAQKLILSAAEKYRQRVVQLLTNWGQLAYGRGEWARSARFLLKGRELVKRHGYFWWQSAIDYWLGKLAGERGEMERARKAWQSGLLAAQGKGSPEYLSLILLELARLERDEGKRLVYIEHCLQAVEDRASYHVRQICREGVGELMVAEGEDKRNKDER